MFRSDAVRRGAGRPPVPALRAVVTAVLCLARIAAAQSPGDADCDARVDANDVTALVEVLFEGSDCPGADANGDEARSAADLAAIISMLDVSLPACPAVGAAVRITVNDLTDAPQLGAKLSGRCIQNTCRNTSGLAETYEIDAATEPQTVPRLAPGVWVHSIVVDTPPTGQQQYQRNLLVAGAQPGAVVFTAFPSVATVDTTEDSADSGTLRAALTWAETAPRPALIQFDETAFPPGRPTAITLTGTLLRLSVSEVTLDGIDANGGAGYRIIDANGLDIPALSITGGFNTLLGLRLRNTGPRNRDVLSISGAAAQANVVDRCVIENSDTGDGIGIDSGAGTDFLATANVIRNSEVTGASDKGVKVTTNAYARLENNWIHDNVNGGVQATLSGHVYAIDNLVERSSGGTAQNGFAANGAATGASPIASELRTDGNIARFNGANGIAVLGFSLGVLSNDYLSANGSSGLRVDNRDEFPAFATVEGVAAVCNGVDGAVVTDNSEADLGGPMSAGNNAFTQNNLPGGGANLRNGTAARVYALNNQWEHCGREPECNEIEIAASDISDHGVHTLFSPTQAHRAQQAPVINAIRPAKAEAGELVRLLGFGFNVIDGHAADATCPDTATRNRCAPGMRGNCVRIGGVSAPVEAVTPTMLVVRMPFSCVESVPLTVETQGGGISAVRSFCNE